MQYALLSIYSNIYVHYTYIKHKSNTNYKVFIAIYIYVRYTYNMKAIRTIK